jgi:hypothetical protein
MEKWRSLDRSETSPLFAPILEADCGSCHAHITFTPPDMAGPCPFCGTHIIAQIPDTNPVNTPGSVLPFKIGHQAAQQILIEWLNSLRVAPSSLKTLAQRQSLQGIYLPFWTFDCQTHTQYTGQRGTYHYVTKTRQVQDSNGDWETETYEEREVEWGPSVSGRVSRAFDDILVPATQSVDVNQLNRIGPWSLEALVAYEPSYLRGFQAQQPQVSLPRGVSQGRQVMVDGVTEAIRRDIGGDTQRINAKDITYEQVTFKHILLPVWKVVYRFKNQSYYVLINGQNGNIDGDCPRFLWGIRAVMDDLLSTFTRIWRIGGQRSVAPATDAAIDPAAPLAPPSLSTRQDSRFFSQIAKVMGGLMLGAGVLWGGYSYLQGRWQLPTELTNSTNSLPESPSPEATDDPVAVDSPSIAPSAEATAPATDSAMDTAEPLMSSSPVFEAGLSIAYEAATQTQAAQSKQEWQEVSNLWAGAIETLKQVPANDPNAAIAPQKIQDYQRNLNYARERSNQAP